MRLKFDPKTVKKPIISLATMRTSTPLNIIRASVGPREGEIVIEVEEDKAESVASVLREYGVKVDELVETIEKDDERCVHCGACISICPVEAISFNSEMKVIVDSAKCVHCGSCVKVCPFKALKLPS